MHQPCSAFHSACFISQHMHFSNMEKINFDILCSTEKFGFGGVKKKQKKKPHDRISRRYDSTVLTKQIGHLFFLPTTEYIKDTIRLIHVCYVILACLVPRSGLSDETTWANENCLTWICSAGVWQTLKTAWFMLTADRAYSCTGGASWVRQLCLF